MEGWGAGTPSSGARALAADPPDLECQPPHQRAVRPWASNLLPLTLGILGRKREEAVVPVTRRMQSKCLCPISGSTCLSARGPRPHGSVNPAWADVLTPHDKETCIFRRNSPLLILAMRVITTVKHHGSQSGHFCWPPPPLCTRGRESCEQRGSVLQAWRIFQPCGLWLSPHPSLWFSPGQ